MFDCIIVGAGPAGGSAAYHLAKRGRSVLILEKETLPRYKPCGGGVSSIVAEWFDFDFSPVISAKVKTIHYNWKMGDAAETHLTSLEPMWTVRRDVFDHFLVQQAQRQGAELRDGLAAQGIAFNGDHWQINTSQGTFAGRYLIAADGAKGPMAKWLGFKDRKQRMASTLEAETSPPVDQAHTTYFGFGTVKNGYIWNCPKADGYSISAITFMGGEPQNLQDLLTDYAKVFGIDLQAIQQYDHPLCLWDGNRQLHTHQAVLVGEAACMVDPFTAEGIRPSIASAIKAAVAIDQALSGQTGTLEHYTKTIHEEWGTDMVWAQRLAGVFYRFPGIGYRIGVKRPLATQKMAEILCGKLRYSDVTSIAIKKLTSSLIPGRGG